MTDLKTQNAELIEQINSLQAARGRMVDEHFEEKKELKAQLAKANERVKDLERDLSIAEKHLHDEHFEWYVDETEQLRKEQDGEQ